MKRFAGMKKFIMMTGGALMLPLLAILFALLPIKVTHAAGHIRFGSESYSPNANENFNIGVYVESTDEVPMGSFSVTLTYDPNVIEYVGGASAGGNGSITINGASPDGGTVRTMLTLKAVGKGNTNIGVTGATINDNTGVGMAVDGMPGAPIHIQSAKTTPPEYLSVNGERIAAFSDTRFEYTVNIPYTEKLQITGPAGYKIETDVNELKVGRNNVKASVSKDDGQPIEYTLHLIMAEKDDKAQDDKNQGGKNEKASEKTSDKTSEKASEKTSVKTSEKESVSEEIKLPPMPEPSQDYEDRELERNRNYILVLVAFILGIIVVVGLKLLADYIGSRRGRTTDSARANFHITMKKNEVVEEATDPFQYATIDEYNGKKVKKGQEPKLIFDKPAKGAGERVAGGKATGQKGAADAAGSEVPKLDFSKRKSAAQLAREEAANNAVKETKEEVMEEMNEDEISDFIENVTEDAGDDVELIDIENEVADRKPKKKG